MTVEMFTDPHPFLDHVAPFLASEPLSTNVIGVVTERIAAGSEPEAPTRWFVLAGADGQVTGTAMFNPPWNLFVSKMDPQFASALADRVVDEAVDVPGITGAADAIEAFVARWTTRTGRTARRVGGRHVYLLGDLAVPTGIAGEPRLAIADEVPLVADWLTAFHEEAVEDDPDVDTTEAAENRIASGDVWLWTLDDEPVSMAACSAPAVGVARIGPVYTPPDRRCHGYGAGVTAAAAAAALDGGAAHVMLYADVDNATSNGVYRRLGFRFDHDAAQYQFD